MSDSPVTIFVCRRGVDVPRCATHGRRTNRGCEFPLRGEKTGSTCSKPLCQDCGIGYKGLVVCAPHQRLLSQEEKERTDERGAASAEHAGPAASTARSE